MDNVEDKEKKDIFVIARCVIIVAVGVVCLIGNSLVIRTLFFFKYPKIPMYIAIGSLAVADIVRALSDVPNLVIYWTNNGQLFTTAWCKGMSYLSAVSMYVAACHLVGLSVIRCILLNDRVHVHSYVIHALVGSAIIWAVTILTNIPGIDTSSKDEDLNMCVEKNSEIGTKDERNLWLRITFSYILPILVIAVIYFITHYFSKRFFAESYSRGEHRLSRLVTLLIVTWAFCKLPYEILNITVFYKSRDMENLLMGVDFDKVKTEFEKYITLGKVEKWMECVSIIDLAIRPIVYAKLSHYFSRGFDEIINCTSCRESPSKPRYRKQRSSDSHTTQMTDIETVETRLNNNFIEIAETIEEDDPEDEDGITVIRDVGPP